MGDGAAGSVLMAVANSDINKSVVTTGPVGVVTAKSILEVQEIKLKSTMVIIYCFITNNF